MRFLKNTLLPAAAILSPTFLAAQNVPRPTATLALAGYDVQGANLPANSSPTLLNFTMEADTTGDNVFDVCHE